MWCRGWSHHGWSQAQQSPQHGAAGSSGLAESRETRAWCPVQHGHVSLLALFLLPQTWWGEPRGWLCSTAAVCLPVRGAACSHLQHLAVLPRLSRTGHAPAQLAANREERGPAQAGSSWWVRNPPPASVFANCSARAHATCHGVQPSVELRAQIPALHAASTCPTCCTKCRCSFRGVHDSPPQNCNFCRY